MITRRRVFGLFWLLVGCGGNYEPSNDAAANEGGNDAGCATTTSNDGGLAINDADGGVIVQDAAEASLSLLPGCYVPLDAGEMNDASSTPPFAGQTFYYPAPFGDCTASITEVAFGAYFGCRWVDGGNTSWVHAGDTPTQCYQSQCSVCVNGVCTLDGACSRN